MPTFNMLDAKSNLSRLVEAVESGREKEIVIARNGRPAARLVPIETPIAGKRLGVAKGRFADLEPDPALDAEVEKLFRGSR